MTPENMSPFHQELTRRACEAARRVALRLGVPVEEPVVLAQTFALRVHLRPAPLVARVSTLTAEMRRPIAPWLAREISAVSFLAQEGAPVVPPSDLVHPGPYEEDGFGVSFWRYVPTVRPGIPSPEESAALLATLHRALRGYSAPLPLLGPAREDIPAGLARAEARGSLSGDDLALLRDEQRRLFAQIDAGGLGDVQPIHGDSHAWNLIGSEQGWLWNDFEDVCSGPIAWDVGSIDFDGSAKHLHPKVDPQVGALCQSLRRLQLLAWRFGLFAEWPAWIFEAAPLLDALRKERSA